jgi:hypothetical protein
MTDTEELQRWARSLQRWSDAIADRFERMQAEIDELREKVRELSTPQITRREWIPYDTIWTGCPVCKLGGDMVPMAYACSNPNCPLVSKAIG